MSRLSAGFISASFVVRAPRLCGAGGFTAIELLVTMAVLVIVLAVAAPNLMRFTAANRASTLAIDLTTSLAVARSEAARNGRAVFLVAGSGAVTGNEFGGGWNLYLDTDGDGSLSAAEIAATPNPLRTYPAVPSSLRLRGSGGVRQIVFGVNGFLVPAATVTLEVCPVDGSPIGVRIEIPPNGLADVTRRITCS
jgi:type IV fimbrial biogenesis protein FimT